MMKQLTTLLLAAACCLTASAQVPIGDSGFNFTGSVQSDFLIPQKDEAIGADKEHAVETNTYVDLGVTSLHFDAGFRFEFTKYPLPGFEPDFKGWGVRHFYVKGKIEQGDLTLGTFYDQFGSGFIFRTYEERSLGIDNSILGARVAYRPYKGIALKALTGKQRHYWRYNKSWITGADAEFNLDQWIPAMQEHDVRLMLGGSYVNKYENPDEVVMADPTHRYNFPKYVNAFDVRAQLQKGGFSVLAEYAHKSQDPSFDNNYTYERGHVTMLSTSYSQKGFSILLQAKHSKNMTFRSEHSVTGTSSMINHLPAFTMDHTYALAALYPYATRPNGEWAFQAQVGYNFKRGTALGGRYGTNIEANFSHVRDAGVTFYQDINAHLSKRISKPLHLNLIYINQRYNKTIVEGHGGMVRSNIFIADLKYSVRPKITLRGELQYLSTRDDEGDWWQFLAELSLVPHWMLTVTDMFNTGTDGHHYYQGLVTFTTGAHRLQAGYGRTRAGYNCSGGVCRYVPASKGVTLSYNYNF